MNLLLYKRVVILLVLSQLIKVQADVDYVQQDYDEFVSACERNPCLNRGMCINNEVGRNCICSYGFSGENCEIDISSTTVTTAKTTSTTATTTSTTATTTSTLEPAHQSDKHIDQFYIIILLNLIIVFLLLLLTLACIILIRQHKQFKRRPVVNRETIYNPTEAQVILPNAFDDKRPPAKITYVSATYFENENKNEPSN